MSDSDFNQVVISSLEMQHEDIQAIRTDISAIKENIAPRLVKLETHWSNAVGAFKWVVGTVIGILMIWATYQGVVHTTQQAQAQTPIAITKVLSGPHRGL